VTYRITASVLGAMTLLLVVGSCIWAYSTFDFWERGPMLGSVGLAAAASAGTLYFATKRLPPALLGGVLVGAGHFVLLLATTLARWEG
jgi:hypothetical protein